MRDGLNRSCRTLREVKGRLSLASLALLFLILGSVPHPLAQEAAKAHRKVLVMIDPEYPSIVRNGHFEGQVRLEATVLSNGNVAKVEIKGGNPVLSPYASQAVMRWKYAPAPTSTVEEVVVVFNLIHR
jgi:TonB family protein